MAKFDAQTSDSAQTFKPGAVSRDNDLKVNGVGSAQDIARMDQRDTTDGKRPAADDTKVSNVGGANG